MRIIQFSIRIFSIIVFCLSSNIYADEGAAGVVKERIERFKQNKKDLKSMKSAIEAGDMKELQVLTARMEKWAKDIPSAFPPHSNPKPSEASDEIWRTFDDFKNKAANHRTAVQELMQASQAGSSTQVLNKALDRLGASCKSCHKAYKK